MYFGHEQALDWCATVAARARGHQAVLTGRVRLIVIPTYLQIVPALEAFARTPVEVGAQDVAAADAGPYTGEVSARELREIGVTSAEIGHAERRRLFGETDEVVAAKTAAALRNGITPFLCVGESRRQDPAAAAATAVAQVRTAVGTQPGPLVVAYEPVWAIGAAEPASAEHIVTVCDSIRSALDELPDRERRVVVYGGSAGPGLLAQLGGAADGLFLGRRAHDPAALFAVIDEAADDVTPARDPSTSGR